MWREAPIITTVIIVIPTTVIGTMCYCMWTVDLQDDNDVDEEDEDEDEDERRLMADEEREEEEPMPALEDTDHHLKSE